MAIGVLYRSFLELAREARVDVDAVLAGLGFNEAQLGDPATRLSPDQSRRLGRALIARVGDPEIGLRAAERIALSDVDLLGYLFRHAPHPLGALEQLARYALLVGDSADCRIEHAAGRVGLNIGLADGRQMLPEACDFYVAGCVRLVRELSGGQVCPLEVQLSRPRPRRPAQYRRHFSCSVTFEHERNLILYDAAPLTVPFGASDPRLLAILSVRAEQVIAALPRCGNVVERVRVEIGRQLESGEHASGAIAAELGMSERTLRRQLRLRGQSYRKILDEVRRERALALIEQGVHNVTDIAQRVGFADTSAFARAFRRWTGVAPHAYRAR